MKGMETMNGLSTHLQTKQCNLSDTKGVVTWLKLFVMELNKTETHYLKIILHLINITRSSRQFNAKYPSIGVEEPSLLIQWNFEDHESLSKFLFWLI